MTLTSTNSYAYAYPQKNEIFKVHKGIKSKATRKRGKFEEIVFKSNDLIDFQADFSFEDLQH